MQEYCGKRRPIKIAHPSHKEVNAIILLNEVASMRIGSPFKIFVGRILDELTGILVMNMRTEVRKKSDDYILNVNETEFSNYLTNHYSLENIEVKFDDVFITHEEHLGDRTITIKYHLPFSGDTELLHSTPNPFVHWTTTVTVEENCICFELTTYSDNPGDPTRQAKEIMDGIRQQTTNVINQVNEFNKRLPSLVVQAIQSRKQEVLKKNNFVASLGVPIRAKDDFPTTFTIPNP